MGVAWLQLVDFDTVDENNLASQGFLEEDPGKQKAEVTAELRRQIPKWQARARAAKAKPGEMLEQAA
jgi:molybdopterin/thiamine biosynthesis adenylyltransferase